MQALELQNLSFRFSPGADIFFGLNAGFDSGQIYLIDGEHGSGRSTLMRILAGLLRPTDGAYLIEGVDFTKLSFEESVSIRRQFGVAFEFGGLLANLSTVENLRLPLVYHGDVSEDVVQERVESVIELLGLEQIRDHRPAVLSPALRKVVSVARALITHPRFVLLDHPFDGLQESKIEQLLRLIQQHRNVSGLSVLILTGSHPALKRELTPVSMRIHQQKLLTQGEVQ